MFFRQSQSTAKDGILNNGYVMNLKPQNKSIIKSPRYTGGDFMFLYRFVRRRRRRPQILVHAVTFEPFFWISFICGTIVGPDL